MKTDYYKTLNTSRDATPEEIKKAFRKLALDCHPDRHPHDPQAEEKFKKIYEAYSILSNPEKRLSYDRDESEFLQTETSTPYPSWSDLREDLFSRIDARTSVDKLVQHLGIPQTFLGETYTNPLTGDDLSSASDYRIAKYDSALAMLEWSLDGTFKRTEGQVLPPETLTEIAQALFHAGWISQKSFESYQENIHRYTEEYKQEAQDFQRETKEEPLAVLQEEWETKTNKEAVKKQLTIEVGKAWKQDARDKKSIKVLQRKGVKEPPKEQILPTEKYIRNETNKQRDTDKRTQMRKESKEIKKMR